MTEPLMPQKHSYKIELEPGEYLWCACGKSENQPFCDDSHNATDCQPVQFEITVKKIYSICGCKRSEKNAFCDGTHKLL
ncbi:MAG: cytochrome C551 [Ignavibacteriae bacterium HGW-Ignavibacteriae-1]|nr:MAG: cytochrome C551 [Ignavibacteriae bacterium HGW-Ignavibacteriae-1]